MGKRGAFCLGVFGALLISTLAHADGVFVWQKGVDIEEPSQKAVILYDDGIEDLVLQVQYAGEPADFAWVVPLPSEPKVSRVDGDVFSELSLHTQQRARIGMQSLGAMPSEAEGVEVLQHQKIGIYDVAVLQYGDAASLVKWLNENGFTLPDKAEPIIADYVKRKWIFSALRIHPDAKELWAQGKVEKGTLAPLKFTFASPQIVYPLKISSLNKGKCEVLIYVLYKDAVVHPSFDAQAPSVFSLREANRPYLARALDADRKFFATVGKEQLPICAQVLPRLEARAFYLSKLRRQFNAAEMQYDPVFTTPEELDVLQQVAFVTRQAGQAAESYSPVPTSALFLRTPSGVSKFVQQRLTKSQRVGDGCFALLSYVSTPEALAVLESAASNPDLDTRRALVRGLRLLPNDRCVPLLTKLAEEKDLVGLACEALAATGTDSALKALSELATAKSRTTSHDTEKLMEANRSRRCALTSLSTIGNPKLIETYKRALENGDLSDNEEYYCIEGLGHINDPSAVALLKQLSESSKNGKNRELAKSLLQPRKPLRPARR